jgi:hypothetical protein
VRNAGQKRGLVRGPHAHPQREGDDRGYPHLLYEEGCPVL